MIILLSNDDGYRAEGINILFKSLKKIALSDMDGIVVPGGFGDRGIEGKIATVKYARENGIPYLGICLGMQVAIIEAARNLAELDGAQSTEFDKKTKHPVIALITEWQEESGDIEERDENSDLGGTMRLGASWS